MEIFLCFLLFSFLHCCFVSFYNVCLFPYIIYPFCHLFYELIYFAVHSFLFSEWFHLYDFILLVILFCFLILFCYFIVFIVNHGVISLLLHSCEIVFVRFIRFVFPLIADFTNINIDNIQYEFNLPIIGTSFDQMFANSSGEINFMFGIYLCYKIINKLGVDFATAFNFPFYRYMQKYYNDKIIDVPKRFNRFSNNRYNDTKIDRKYPIKNYKPKMVLYPKFNPIIKNEFNDTDLMLFEKNVIPAQFKIKTGYDNIVLALNKYANIIGKIDRPVRSLSIIDGGVDRIFEAFMIKNYNAYYSYLSQTYKRALATDEAIANALVKLLNRTNPTNLTDLLIEINDCKLIVANYNVSILNDGSIRRICFEIDNPHESKHLEHDLKMYASAGPFYRFWAHQKCFTKGQVGDQVFVDCAKFIKNPDVTGLHWMLAFRPKFMLKTKPNIVRPICIPDAYYHLAQWKYDKHVSDAITSIVHETSYMTGHSWFHGGAEKLMKFFDVKDIEVEDPNFLFVEGDFENWDNSLIECLVHASYDIAYSTLQIVYEKNTKNKTPDYLKALFNSFAINESNSAYIAPDGTRFTAKVPGGVNSGKSDTTGYNNRIHLLLYYIAIKRIALKLNVDYTVVDNKIRKKFGSDDFLIKIPIEYSNFFDYDGIYFQTFRDFKLTIKPGTLIRTNKMCDVSIYGFTFRKLPISKFTVKYRGTDESIGRMLFPETIVEWFENGLSGSRAVGLLLDNYFNENVYNILRQYYSHVGSPILDLTIPRLYVSRLPYLLYGLDFSKFSKCPTDEEISDLYGLPNIFERIKDKIVESQLPLLLSHYESLHDACEFDFDLPATATLDNYLNVVQTMKITKERLALGKNVKVYKRRISKLSHFDYISTVGIYYGIYSVAVVKLVECLKLFFPNLYVNSFLDVGCHPGAMSAFFLRRNIDSTGFGFSLIPDSYRNNDKFMPLVTDVEQKRMHLFNGKFDVKPCIGRHFDFTIIDVYDEKTESNMNIVLPIINDIFDNKLCNYIWCKCIIENSNDIDILVKLLTKYRILGFYKSHVAKLVNVEFYCVFTHELLTPPPRHNFIRNKLYTYFNTIANYQNAAIDYISINFNNRNVTEHPLQKYKMYVDYIKSNYLDLQNPTLFECDEIKSIDHIEIKKPDLIDLYIVHLIDYLNLKKFKYILLTFFGDRKLCYKLRENGFVVYVGFDRSDSSDFRPPHGFKPDVVICNNPNEIFPKNVYLNIVKDYRTKIENYPLIFIVDSDDYLTGRKIFSFDRYIGVIYDPFIKLKNKTFNNNRIMKLHNTTHTIIVFGDFERRDFKKLLQVNLDTFLSVSYTIYGFVVCYTIDSKIKQPNDLRKYILFYKSFSGSFDVETIFKKFFIGTIT